MTEYTIYGSSCPHGQLTTNPGWVWGYCVLSKTCMDPQEDPGQDQKLKSGKKEGELVNMAGRTAL